MKVIFFKCTCILWILGLCFSPDLTAQKKAYKRVVKLMGSAFELTAVSEDSLKAMKGIALGIAEIQRIDNLVSTWKEGTQAMEINRNAGIRPVVVDREVFNLIVRCKKISELTEGAFDITFSPLMKIWKFDGSMRKLPPHDSIQKYLQKVNYRHILLDSAKSSVYLKEKGMELGFGAIGQGYAVNRAKEKMLAFGIEAGLVNGSGDILTWGKREDGSDWLIGIAHPADKKQMIAWLKLNDAAVTTSGDYEYFSMIDGIRYTHILDPRTGYPVRGVRSVSVLCRDAEIADALDTAVFVLGVEKGLELVNQLNGVDCLIVDEKNEIKVSKNLKLNFYDKIKQKVFYETGIQKK